MDPLNLVKYGKRLISWDKAEPQWSR